MMLPVAGEEAEQWKLRATGGNERFNLFGKHFGSNRSSWAFASPARRQSRPRG